MRGEATLPENLPRPVSRPVTPGPFPEAPVVAHVGLGSNLGNRFAHLQGALDEMVRSADMTLLNVSPVYQTEPHVLHARDAQADYYNAVAVLRTALSPRDLLDRLLTIERARGRVRRPELRWRARTLDLDLLLYGSETLDLPDLVVPHPRLHERRFVLQPLFDLNPDLMVPAPHARTVRDLLRHCPDHSAIQRLTFELRSESPQPEPGR